MSKEQLSTEKRVSAIGEFLNVLFFLPAIVAAVWIGYPILILRLAWNFSGKLLKEITND